LPESTTAASICGEEGIEQGAKRRRAIGPIGVRAAGAVDVCMGRMQDLHPVDLSLLGWTPRRAPAIPAA
jgi:hypothetical protein